MLQQAVDGLDMAYQPRPGEVWKGLVERQLNGLFGSIQVLGDYYHDPADAALGKKAG